MVRLGVPFWVTHKTLKSVGISQLKNKSMNWADFLHAGSEGIIFGYNMNHAPAFKYSGAPL